MAFSWLAGRITTKGALSITLVGWIFIIMFGVSVTPLNPHQRQDFDYQLSYQAGSGAYVVERAPEPEDSRLARRWRQELDSLGPASATGATGPSLGAIAAGDTLTDNAAGLLLDQVGAAENSLYGISLAGGGLDGETAVGRLHPSALGDGPIDWWPALVRHLLWEPLGLDAEYQWLLLGVGVGLVIGGSQALARSLFAQIAPHTRSGEFFSFFGFMGRVSSVFGPILYVAVTALFDTRLAVVSIMGLIIAGAIVLRWVDVAAGTEVADAEDARHYAEAGEPLPG